MLALARRPDSSALTAWDEALRLRELLKFDFFFPRRRELGDELRAEFALFDPEARRSSTKLTQADAQSWLDGRRAPRRPSGAAPLPRRLLRRGRSATSQTSDEAFDEAAFLDECLRVGRQWVLERFMASEESLSTEMFRTALKLAAASRLVRY